MHYRFRGNNIQVVKSRLNPESGKAKSVPLGSINRATLAISDKLKRNCSEEELNEIKAWVKRHRLVHDLKHRHAALTLAEQIAAAIEWIRRAPNDEVAELADDLLEATGALRRVLAKRSVA
jgi:hypothetical protein